MEREKETCPGSGRPPFYRVQVNLRINKWVGECSVCHAPGLEVGRKDGRIIEHTRFRPLDKGERPSTKQTNQDIWSD